jgi:hypothetical protein
MAWAGHARARDRRRATAGSIDRQAVTLRRWRFSSHGRAGTRKNLRPALAVVSLWEESPSVAREDEVHRCWCGALCPDDDSGSSAGDITCFRARICVEFVPLPMLCCLDVYHPLFNLGWVEGLLCSKTKERELSGRQLSRERHENERQQPSNLDTVVILLPGSVELEAKKPPYS